MIKPVMSAEVERAVDNALSFHKRKDLWQAWGMASIRKQGVAVLLEGPPGTGKTTIARYMAEKVKKGFKKLDVAAIASEGAPGEIESNVHAFFADCRRRKNCTIFIDECDHVFISREQIGEAGKTWQLGTVETLMVEMNTYPGLIICATNHPKLMDSALADRFLAIITVETPTFEGRCRLWKQKLPRTFPLQLTHGQVNTLSKIVLTGRQIESVILNVASNAIRLDKKPTFNMFEEYANRIQQQKL